MRTVNGVRVDDLVGDKLTVRRRLVIPLAWSMFTAACRGLARNAVWLARRWSLSVPLTVVLAAGYYAGWLPTGAAAAALAVLLVGWRLVHASSFGRVLAPVIGNWRLSTRYWWRWRGAMIGAGLAVQHEGGQFLPVITSARSTAWTDTLRVRLLHGQTPEDFAVKAEGLRHVYRAHRCTAREISPGLVGLTFYARDPLVNVVPALPIPAAPDLAALPLGLVEDGELYRLRLLGSHVLVAGATGAGKGSVSWSLIRSLAPLVRSGAVELWVIDPKGGMEMTFGRPLFARYEDTDLEGMALLLEDAADQMEARTRRLKGTTRQHTPSPTDPYVVLIVDEIASLTAYCPDRDIKRRVQLALSLLLSKGRAPGYSVVAALQDPRKDVLPFRDLFPTRIALRLSEKEQVSMTIGDGARDRGAYADKIPLSLPGVGYVVLDDNPDPVRVRFGWVCDDDIAATCQQYAPTAGSAITTATPGSTVAAGPPAPAAPVPAQGGAVIDLRPAADQQDSNPWNGRKSS